MGCEQGRQKRSCFLFQSASEVSLAVSVLVQNAPEVRCLTCSAVRKLQMG